MTFCFSRSKVKVVLTHSRKTLKAGYRMNYNNLVQLITMMRERCLLFFTCVTKGESRSRSSVTTSVCPSVRPKILSLQLLWNYWSNYHETWYVDRTSYVVMLVGRKFWSPHLCGSYAPWNLENTHKWPCHHNSSETTDPIYMKLGM